MPRLTYAAPGVYVEEIPSARQPIAGVGTNTAGFIGLIPEDVIYVPAPYSDYDPMLARSLINYQRLLGPEGSEDHSSAIQERKRLTAELTTIERDIAELQKAADTAEQEATTARGTEGERRTAVEHMPTTATPTDREHAEKAAEEAQFERAKKDAALKEANDRLGARTKERDQIRNQLNLPIQPPGGQLQVQPQAAPASWIEQEDSAYDTVQPDDGLKVSSRLRPYTLKQVPIKVEECSTKLCTNFTEYTLLFGPFSAFKAEAENPHDDPSNWVFKPLHPGHHYLTHAVDGFFRNGGTRCFVARVKRLDQLKRVLEQFESIEDVAILAAPGLPKGPDTWGELESYCEDDSRQNVFAILDCPAVVTDGKSNTLEVERLKYESPDSLMPRRSPHAAYYFPYIEVVDPAKELQDYDPARQVPPKYRGRTYVAPSGHIAGVYARTDEERGVHKAPANATVRGAIEVKYYVSKPKQELLNPHGVNCIRLMDGNVTVWGARTVGGDRNGEWKYVNVRRFAGFLEKSIMDGTQWIVFEPNDPNLWSRIILNVTAFLTNVWRSGALFGLTPQEAFYVKCDAELNPPEVRDLGQVVTEIGVAIVRPAEFVIFRIAQIAGQSG
ncbi:MAG: phage tail sheath subtilisin-like domain-containing protein [Acetobacteraceae bacterium]|nr:phage tail sheath subtilisin-like domain-containing protein [Acetobacteraceae bacterium]MBV8614643.1 phage tail sheath subtilisin-like domain-containing protein [Acetobacteraceae bacterium]